MLDLPAGFRAHVANVGIKDSTLDFAVVAADRPVSAAAVFTQSRFVGASVTISKDHVADGRLQAVVVVSKNSNVATGERGMADAVELAKGVGAVVGADARDVLVASTGVIGRPYPIDKIRSHLASMPAPGDADALAVATAMMTTDTHPKTAEARAGAARVVGLAKGVGMIEPNMATMLAFVFTDAEVAPAELDERFRRVVDRTFNSLTVDTDTSTSDTAAVLASGVAGPVDGDALEAALYEVCVDLTRQLASDGEGAKKLLVVTVDGARDDAQAKRVAKLIANSPLVKTAVHGADPNWGRIAMAIGKAETDTDIDQDAVVIRIGGQELYPRLADDDTLAELSAYLRNDEVLIHCSLGIADGTSTVYGCDLTAEYVRFNSEYTT